MALPALALFVLLATRQDSVKVQNLNPLIQSIDFEQIDIRDALQRLATQTGVKIRVDKAVNGTVTAYLKRVTLSVALQSVMRQVDGGFEIRDGAYTTFVSHSAPSKQRIDVLQLVDVDAQFALKKLFELTPLKFEIANNVHGKGQWEFENLPFESALRGILNSVGGDYQVKGGVYYIQNGPVYKAK